MVRQGLRNLWRWFRSLRPSVIGYVILALCAVAGFIRVEQIANRQAHIIVQLKQQQALGASERRANVRRFSQADLRMVSSQRTMICALQRNTLTSRQRTDAEKADVIRFYKIALDAIHARPCSEGE